MSILEEVQATNGKDPKSFIPVTFSQGLDSQKKIIKYLDFMEYGVFLVFIYFLFKRLRSTGGGNDMFQMGKTNIKIYGVDHKISTRFENVAG